MTSPGGAAPGPSAHFDIQRVTLDGYSPGRRDHFERSLTARLASLGAPSSAARQAAEAILDSVDARLGHSHG